MPKSAFTAAHKIVVDTLANGRKEAGIHQADLAAKLGKDQSFVSNIERGQRRVDLIEFFAICKAINLNPVVTYEQITSQFPDHVNI